MTSILDHAESIARHTICPECGGTVLTGCGGTEEEHDYCDSCDWERSRSEDENWYIWATDGASGGLWAADPEAALAQLVAEHEWAKPGSRREAADLAEGAWLRITDGVFALVSIGAPEAP